MCCGETLVIFCLCFRQLDNNIDLCVFGRFDIASCCVFLSCACEFFLIFKLTSFERKTSSSRKYLSSFIKIV